MKKLTALSESKFIFWWVTITTALRDFFTDASNNELSLYLIAGMAVVYIVHLLFEPKDGKS